MSKVTTYLTLVFIEDDPSRLPEDENTAVKAVESAGIAPFPLKRERHLSFILETITPEGMKILEDGKSNGLIANFYIRDEISPDE